MYALKSLKIKDIVLNTNTANTANTINTNYCSVICVNPQIITP
jgi:hypothetical protein